MRLTISLFTCVHGTADEFSIQFMINQIYGQIHNRHECDLSTIYSIFKFDQLITEIISERTGFL